MSNERQNKKETLGIILLAVFLCLTPLTLSAYKASDFNWRPPFTFANEKPSVSIILDTSSSMHRMAYAYIDGNKEPVPGGETDYRKSGVTFDKSTLYYGYFDPKERYNYANTTRSGDLKNSGYFYVDQNGSWNGTFMNWATMHRIDVMRKILTGGKYSNSTVKSDSTTANSTHIFFDIEITDSPSGSDDSTALKGNTREIDAGINSTGMTPFAGQVILAQHPLTDYLYVYNSSNLPNTDNAPKALGGPYQLRIAQQGNLPAENGVLDFFTEENGSTKARFSLFRYYQDAQGNNHKGSQILVNMSDAPGTMTEIKTNINNLWPSGPAPLSEALYTILGYLGNVSQLSATGPKYMSDAYNTEDPLKDPYYFSKYGGDVSCTEQNILFITPGEVRQDGSIPNDIRSAYPQFTNSQTSAFGLKDDKSIYILNTAYHGYMGIGDLRPSENMSGNQTATLYTVAAFGKGNHLLRYAAIYGGFTDYNNNRQPGDGSSAEDPRTGLKSTGITIPNSSEYKPAGQDLPNNYYEGDTGEEIKNAIMQALLDATRGKMSGTAAAVTSQTRSGEGAVYQALFFPPSNATGADLIGSPWSGQVHALLVDSKGNMREDTNNNKKLDPDNGTTYTDRVITFNDEGKAFYNSTTTNMTPVDTQDIRYLWSSTNWLNLTTINAASQRNAYSDTDTHKRFIKTFLDSGNMVPTTPSTQYIDFSTSNTDSLAPYLTLYPSFEDTPTTIAALSQANRNSLCSFLAPRQINFIRGQEISNDSSQGYSDKVRNRRDNNGISWPLGDIVYSSPTVVGSPTENYHILYNDTSYKNFYLKYKNRRQVVYVGANDGMLHAFNAGFYNSTRRGFDTQLSNEAKFELGSELWAFIPFNLLPHLRWLMEPEYGMALHVPYMDLKPRVFDARVFTPSEKHPEGWGTILVAGMRFGGGKIAADINKNNLLDSSDRVMSSAYVIMDITDPEGEPALLGEIRMPKLGFTTNYPTVMPMSTQNANGTADTNNNWYLVFGSGPADSNGEARTIPTDYRSPAISAQPGQVYILDLKWLVQKKQVRMLNESKSFITGNATFAITENPSIIGDPVAVDVDFGSRNKNKEFKTDIIYYGTTSGDELSPSGTMRRIMTFNDNNNDNVSWTGNSILANIGKPITASANVAMDESKNLWVFFGAGRFYNRSDTAQTHHMSFFGIKDPAYNGTTGETTMFPNTVLLSNIYNSTAIELTNGTCPYGAYDRTCIGVTKSGVEVSGGWNVLLQEIEPYAGWRHDFSDFTPNWERVLGQSAVFGGAVLFTSYMPNEDICVPEGQSRLYALYYKTGTAYYEPILNNSFDKHFSLETGLAITPSIHVGEKGSTAFIQTSTGAIKTIEIIPPINIKPGVLFWRKNTE